jgi:hypothetical protein
VIYTIALFNGKHGAQTAVTERFLQGLLRHILDTPLVEDIWGEKKYLHTCASFHKRKQQGTSRRQVIISAGRVALSIRIPPTRTK